LRTDDDLDTFPFIDKKSFDSVTNWGAKADILRYQIVYLYGGVYIDIDFECLRPLDPLIKSHALFVTIGDNKGLTSRINLPIIANAIIGASPKNDFLFNLIKRISMTDKSKLKDTWFFTGPGVFTIEFFKYIRSEKEFIIPYPIKFFYPLHHVLRVDYWNNRLDRAFILSQTIPDSFAIHYWATSWCE
jgi:mannosyltransferase OCH1-like enzyme